MRRLREEGIVFPGDRDLKRLLKRWCICHSENNQDIGIWTQVTGMKMRFCERCIRVNRQGLGCGRRDETTEWRQFAAESETVIIVSIQMDTRGGSVGCSAESRLSSEPLARLLGRTVGHGMKVTAQREMLTLGCVWPLTPHQVRFLLYTLTGLSVTSLLYSAITWDPDEPRMRRLVLRAIFQHSSIN